MCVQIDLLIIDLEKNQAKWEQYVEFSNIPNATPDNQLEGKVIEVWRDSGVEVDHNDIEGCHRVPVLRHCRDDNKLVIVKFVNRKHSETSVYRRSL